VNDTRKYLSDILASGETEKTLAALKSVFEKNGDTTHLSDVVMLTNRFNQNKNAFHRGILSQADFGLENNKIAAAISNLIEKVPPSTGIPIVTKTEALKIKWEKWAIILVIFAMATGLLIYKSHYQISSKKELPSAEQTTIKPSDLLQQSDLLKDTISSNPNQSNKTAKPAKKNGDIHFINNGKMEKTVIGDNNKVNIQ